ncbi:MAG: energy transducer TonB [Chitinophagales bacterium]|nr:energy transducer TonB [Chitinophagales bacterium]
MSNTNNNSSSVTIDDIIFEGRNKDYGAYQLRKLNGKYIGIGLVISVAFFTTAVLLTRFDLRQSEKKQDRQVLVESVDVELPPEDIPDLEVAPPPPPPPPPDIAQVKFVEMVVKKDEEVADKDVTTIDQALDDKKEISTINKEGDEKKPKVVEEPAPKVFGNGPAVVKEKEDVDDRNYEFYEISEQPEFPGGAAAMQAFIVKNIRYPEVAMDNGIEGTVTVQFLIDKDGSIKDVKVIKDPGGGLGREAERVIKSMPKWKPGKQRDTPVRVKMMAPVRFRLSR